MEKKLTKSQLKTIALSSFGGMLEFYDFIVFVLFIGIISKQFFPVGDFWATINTYGTFAAGYLARPVGGIIMAHFGDVVGRKKMFMLSLLLMAIPTLIMGFLPTFETIGYLAPILLLLVRITQGIALGGELPGAWVFVSEHVQTKHIGLATGILSAAIIFGVGVGTIINLILNHIFTSTEIYEFAWRIPFIIGGIFGIFTIFLRKKLAETPVFKELQKRKELEKLPIKTMFANHGFAVIRSMFATWLITACVLVLLLMMPEVMLGIMGVSKNHTLYLQLGALIGLVFGAPISGYLSDKIGFVKSCIIFCVGLIISSFLFFSTLYGDDVLQNINKIGTYYIISGFFCGVASFSALLIIHSFPAKIRYTGFSFSYNIAYAILGGVTPILFAIIKDTHPMWISAYVGFVMLIGILVALSFIIVPSTIKDAKH